MSFLSMCDYSQTQIWWYLHYAWFWNPLILLILYNDYCKSHLFAQFERLIMVFSWGMNRNIIIVRNRIGKAHFAYFLVQYSVPEPFGTNGFIQTNRNDNESSVAVGDEWNTKCSSNKLSKMWTKSTKSDDTLSF